jgi:hypothetical protein
MFETSPTCCIDNMLPTKAFILEHKSALQARLQTPGSVPVAFGSESGQNPKQEDPKFGHFFFNLKFLED